MPYRAHSPPALVPPPRPLSSHIVPTLSPRPATRSRTLFGSDA